MTGKTPITSPSAPPAGPYSPALAAGEWIFLAGQTGAAYVSSEPGPGGEPLYEWIDVREVMSEAPSDD